MMIKRKVFKQYRKGRKRGGQHYSVGRKRTIRVKRAGNKNLFDPHFIERDVSIGSSMDVLGIKNPYFNESDINKAWKKQAFKYHPDKYQSSTPIHNISFARDVLEGKPVRGIRQSPDVFFTPIDGKYAFKRELDVGLKGKPIGLKKYDYDEEWRK
jgi:hypothetical protein